MKNTIQLVLWISVSLVMLSYTSNEINFSMAQNDAQNQTQTQAQNQSTVSQSKFLKNSTSFGNATAELKIKHAPEFSTLTTQPWPMVEPDQEFNITGILVDKITLQPIPSSPVSFLYESASEEIPPFSLEAIDKQNTDSTGKFSTTANAPGMEGITSVTAVFNGSGLFHSAASNPALVIISNSTLQP